MTNPLDSDFKAEFQGQNGVFPFASSQADLAGIRVTRAQFSRLMGVSKQAVTDWVKSGRIIVGADGRFDPRQAVARLLATGDPARLRAKVLAPLVADVAGRDRSITDLEAQLAAIREDADFEAKSADGFAALFNRLQESLPAAWPALRAAPAAAGLAALAGWLNEALSYGAVRAGEITDYLPAPGLEGEGAGRSTDDLINELDDQLKQELSDLDKLPFPADDDL